MTAPEGTTRHQSRRRRLVRLSTWNAAGLLLFWLLTTFVAERHWLTMLFTYAPQVFFVLPTLLLVAASLLRRDGRALAINGGSVLFCLIALLGFRLGRPFAAQAPTTEPVLRVMTFNIEHGAKGMDNVLRVIEQERPDVACLQEASEIGADTTEAASWRARLTGYHRAIAGDVTIFSRHPVVAARAHPLPYEPYRPIMEARIDFHGRAVTVVNVHLMPVKYDQVLQRRPRDLAAYLRRITPKRDAQVSRLLEIAGSVPGPLVVCGDFNTPATGLVYRRLSRFGAPAFAHAGSGFGYTIPSQAPVVRLDHTVRARRREGAPRVGARAPCVRPPAPSRGSASPSGVGSERAVGEQEPRKSSMCTVFRTSVGRSLRRHPRIRTGTGRQP